MEKECLDLLLRRNQPIVICPARSIFRMRMPKTWKKVADDGRLLVLSPFSENHKRITAELAKRRNRMALLLGKEFFIPYAAPESRTDRLCREIIDAGKKVYIFQSENQNCLVQAGAISIEQAEYIEHFVTNTI